MPSSSNFGSSRNFQSSPMHAYLKYVLKGYSLEAKTAQKN